jgi:large subunit ribosomal protein L4
MSELEVYNMEKKAVGKIPFPEAFGEKVNFALLHQAVVAQRANRRQGTSKVKSRHEVAGSTRKIYRQKGTGRARHGDIKAPLFVGGGRAFGPKPRSYEVRLPQKIRQRALQAAILDRKVSGRLWVVDGLDFAEPKTKKAAALFSKFGIPSGLVVLEGAKPAVEKSIRNLEKFKVCRVASLNLLDILRYEHLVMTKASYEKVMAAVGGLS